MAADIRDLGDRPVIVRGGLVTLQACVPESWTDRQAEEFADGERPTGLDHGWAMCHAGHPDLQGDPERQPCRDRPGFVHIVFEC